MGRGRRLLRLSGALIALASGCAADPAPASQPGNKGSVVAGVTSDLQPGTDLGRLHATMRASGAIVHEETFLPGGDPALRFPLELRFDDLPGDTPIDLALEASDGDTPFLSRLASTRIVAGKTMLLRARIERECIPSYQLPGGQQAPTCAAPDTCIAAACTDPFVPPSKLSEYAPGWAASIADACKPAGHGAPEVEIGQGQTGYEPLADGDPLAVDRGPQGGLHVWLALRMKNLHGQGSITTLAASSPDLGLTFPVAEVSYGYDPTGDGSCQLDGLRYVLANDLSALAPLVGAKLLVNVKVVDDTGDVGLGSRTVILSK